jgi:hypothetical protein
MRSEKTAVGHRGNLSCSAVSGPWKPDGIDGIDEGWSNCGGSLSDSGRLGTTEALQLDNPLLLFSFVIRGSGMQSRREFQLKGGAKVTARRVALQPARRTPPDLIAKIHWSVGIN